MKKAIEYSVAVCLLSWAIFWLSGHIFGDALETNVLLMTATKIIFMSLPMVTAVAFQLMHKDFSANRSFNLNLSWAWPVGVLLIILAVLLTVPICVLLPGVQFHIGADQLIMMRGLDEETAEMLKQQLENLPGYSVIASAVFSAIVAGSTINAFIALGEEYGWRSYLLRCLEGKSFWFAALYIGVIWGIWHAPLILGGQNYPQHPVAGVGMMIVFCILVTVLELYFVLKTGSVVIAAMMHGTINAASSLVIFLVLGGNDLTVGVTGIGGFIALALVIFALYVYDSRISGDRIMSSEIR